MSLLSGYSNTADIRRAIEEKARAYVPEWRYDPDDPDGGTAIAMAFADMFGETAERLGRVPYMYFLNFLNMLETKVRCVSPAAGLARFTLTSNAERGRLIPEGTQLYANVNLSRGESERVVFETQNEITAVPAALTNMFSVDPRYDTINILDFETGGPQPDEGGPQPVKRSRKLFYADMESNIQAHRFTIWQGDVLNLKNPARVTVRLEGGHARFEGGRNTEKFVDPDFAAWSYVRGGTAKPFTKVYMREGLIVLELDSTYPAGPAAAPPGEPEELEMQPHIVCDMHPGRQEPGIMAGRIMLGSAYLYPGRGGVHIAPDFVYYNDISLKPREPGYLFGKEPGRYDTMLISCDEAFSKRGARVDITFVMHTVIRETGLAPDGPVYNWDGRFIIDKDDSKTVTPDNMYISEVVWEYWNGVGWAHLEVMSANLNPFKSDTDVRHENLSFTCPGDMTESYQNSIWGCWIRARIISIENPYSQYGRWQLPFAESISLGYDYGENLQGAQALKLENNAESIVLTENEISTGLNLYKPLVYPEHAVYLAFDKNPAGLPLSVYIGLDGTGERVRTLSFERLIRDPSGAAVFKACKALDETNGLRDSGIMRIYVPDDMSMSSIYGTEAYWLRIVDGDLRFEDGAGMTVLRNVEINAVEIAQKQTVESEYYSTDLFDSGKVITLAERPILSCEVFVDELQEMEPDKITAAPGVTLEYGADGGISAAWVKWDVVPSLTGIAPGSRAVSLDPQDGVLRFGDGIAGRIPPAGTGNIRVKYSYGGGSIGNLPAGAIDGLVSSMLTVAGADNFTSTGGGSDNMTLQVLEKIGPARIHHRGRAVTLSDFENLVLEEFPEAAAVRAFAGLDSRGQNVPSHITVVILPKDTENREQALKLCRNAYSYLAGLSHCEFSGSSKLSVIPALMMTVNSVVEAVAEDITKAAMTERAIQTAISGFLTRSEGVRIGNLPSAMEIFDCLRGIPNLSYVDKISLEGQYFDGGKQVSAALGKPGDFPFACAKNGTHTIRF